MWKKKICQTRQRTQFGATALCSGIHSVQTNSLPWGMSPGQKEALVRWEGKRNPFNWLDRQGETVLSQEGCQMCGPLISCVGFNFTSCKKSTWASIQWALGLTKGQVILVQRVVEPSRECGGQFWVSWFLFDGNPKEDQMSPLGPLDSEWDSYMVIVGGEQVGWTWQALQNQQTKP